MLACPVCHSPLILADTSYHCDNRHSYDIAKDGHINLHIVQHKKSNQAGDTPESVQARRRFLASGGYQALREQIDEIVARLVADGVGGVDGRCIVDIGCGEGYYTESLARHARQVIGLDIAKSAVQTASKTYKHLNNVRWVVGTGAKLPILDNSVDICTSFFSPLPKSEMYRVLKQGGYLLMATPAPMHLFAMRQALFDTVLPHEPSKFIDELADGFSLVNEWQVSSDMQLNNQQLNDLIDMTPYTYKAKLANKTALKTKEDFGLTAAFCLYLFRRV
ncbi:MAG: methyltransferase domain-containing protein [Moraxella sp.]|nr:methyltransferase domain-containing protein [Moraxella sp.]